MKSKLLSSLSSVTPSTTGYGGGQQQDDQHQQITFVPFSMEKKTAPNGHVDSSIQFVDHTMKYQTHVKTSQVHACYPLSSSPAVSTQPIQHMSNSPVPVMEHVASGMPTSKHHHRRASVYSLSASVNSNNSSSSDKSTDSSKSSNNSSNKQTLESQTFQFRVHEKEQPKLVFFNLVTKEQIEKKRKYVRKKAISTTVQIIEDSSVPSLCGKRALEESQPSVNNSSNTATNTASNTDISNNNTSPQCTIPRISLESLNILPPPPPHFIPSKRRTSISIAELLN